MTSELSWYDPDHVIYFRAKDVLTLDELGEAIVFIQDGVRYATGVVHLIVDVRDCKGIPNNVLEIKKRVTYLDRDKMGWIIVVGMNPLISTFVKVLTQLLRTRYQNFKDLKPALEFLMRQDENLADLLQNVND